MTTETTNYQTCIVALNLMKDKYPMLLDEFVNWYEDGGWDDDGLNDEFLEDADESSFIDWIKTEKEDENKSIKTEKEAMEIWQILHDSILLEKEKLKFAIEKDVNVNVNVNMNVMTLNPNKSFVVKLLSTNIEAKEKKKHIESYKSPTKQRIAEQSSSMLPTGSIKGGILFKKSKNQAQDILMCELLGYKNKNYPLLLHFVDSYMRCQLNEWIKNGRQQQDKFSTQDFFKFYCVNPHFRQYMQNDNAKNTIDFVGTAIDSYQKRVLPSFQFMEPVYKINGAMLDIANYFFEIARIARNCANQPIHNFSSIIPMQIDFMILNTKIKDVRPRPEDCAGVSALFSDTSDDEEDETDIKNEDEYWDENENISKDLDKLLKTKKIRFYLYNNPLREMLRCTEDIKRIVDNKRSQRTIFVLDRRQNKNKHKSETVGTDGDKLYLFKPKQFNKFEDNIQELIHASLHHNSVKSIVPRVNDKQRDFTVRESLKGQMFVMSWHILSKEEIRCYLFYQGQCFRFYGEDLINVLPIFFLDAQEARHLLLNQYNKNDKWRKAFDEFANTFIDDRFEVFYHGLTAKSPRINVIQKSTN